MVAKVVLGDDGRIEPPHPPFPGLGHVDEGCALPIGRHRLFGATLDVDLGDALLDQQREIRLDDVAHRTDRAEIGLGRVLGTLTEGLGHDGATDDLAGRRFDDGRHRCDPMIAKGLRVDRDIRPGVDILDQHCQTPRNLS